MSEFDIVQPKYHDVYPYISIDALTGATQGRSVLIVGAGSGIGTATATAFASAGAGNIILTGRRRSNLDDVKSDLNASFPDVNVLAISADGSIANEVDSLFAQIKDAGIVLDVLVNSSGSLLNKDNIVDSDPDVWWKEWEIMLKCPYLTTRAFLRSLPKSGAAPETPTRAIVNVSSLASNTMLPLCNAYGVLKAALNRLTEYSAAEAVNIGVQSVALHPGGIPGTDITKDAPDYLQALYTETPELAAQTILYLSTSGAAYLNGRWIDARWDLEELKTHRERIEKEDLLKTSILGSTRMPIDDGMKKVLATGVM